MTAPTIAAISTPEGRGAIGIVRISGQASLSLIRRIFVRKGFCPSDQDQDAPDLKSHCLYYGNLVDPESNCIVDEVLVIVMHAPRSYTREDIVEIQSHAGPAVLKKILQLVVQNGAELAEPGAFTKRAFLNGRIDLTQAEAVADIIAADSEDAAELAIGHLGGRLSKRVQEIHAELLAIAASMEAGIEFSEELENETNTADETDKLEILINREIRQLIDDHESGQMIKEGYRIAICGKPNVGKSSLMNRMVDKDRVIVTDIPGTTRDTIEEKILIGGHLVRICDMAGIHDSGDPLENIGISRAREYIQRAELVLFVMDISRPFDNNDRDIFKSIRQKNIIAVKNKIDLLEQISSDTFTDYFNNTPSVEISAKYDLQTEQLKTMIANQIELATDINPKTEVAPNFRQTQILKDVERESRHALEAMKKGISAELVVENLYAACRKAEEILGKHIGEDVLEQVFKRFCIGK